MADGKRGLVTYIYADGDLHTPLTKIPANSGHNRTNRVFQALDAAGHPSDTNVAFDFSIVERGLVHDIENALVEDNTTEIGPLMDEDNYATIERKPDGKYTVNDERFIHETFDNVDDMAHAIARLMYPEAAKHEHDPQG
jgi:hypothetical protein